jgi:hypothetical protein
MTGATGIAFNRSNSALPDIGIDFSKITVWGKAAILLGHGDYQGISGMYSGNPYNVIGLIDDGAGHAETAVGSSNYMVALGLSSANPNPIYLTVGGGLKNVQIDGSGFLKGI